MAYSVEPHDTPEASRADVESLLPLWEPERWRAG